MSLTDIFVRRPVLAIVVNLLVVIAGVQAIRALNVRQYPRLESATIVIRTPYVGASADLVRGFITTPIERSVAAAAGIDFVESQSDQGLSTINVRLELNVDAARALADISARVNQVRGDLPPEAEVPAISLEPSDAAFASMYLSFDSKILQDNQVTDYLIRVVQPRLSAVDGVQKADILGGRTFALRAWLKPDRMAGLGISPTQVRQALAANNYLSAIGQTKGTFVQLNLSATTDVESVEDFRRLVIRQQGGTLVRLGDIADVVLGADNYEMDVRMSGDRAVFMGVWVLPNANALDVIKRVRVELAKIEAELPSGLSGAIAFDATKYIDNAIHEVRKTLMETIGIVIIVIFLFLGSLRTVLVPVVAIPVSLIGAIFLMQVFGFSLNLLTLLAIVLSVGLVVDDAIVVVENVDRHMREGHTPFEASLLGARELVGPVIAMTITLAAVYTPIGFQGGLTGALFREFVFTLAGAVLISGVVALTLSPMMSANLLRSSQHNRRLTRAIDAVFDRVRNRYARMLAATLANRPVVYAVWGVLSLLVVPLYMFSAKELAPLEDQGVVFGLIDVPANATMEQLTPFTEKISDTFKSMPEFTHSFQITFPTGGFGGMIVKPWTDRPRSIFQIHQEVSGKLMSITGIRAPAFMPPALPSSGFFPVEFVIASTGKHEELARAADQIVVEAMHSGQFAFPPIIDVKIDQAKAEIVFDREKMASMGLSMQQAGADLATMLGGNFINRFNMEGRSYKVIAQVERAGRLTPTDLGEINITGPGGSLIPLSSIATFRTGVEPRTLNRFQQLNAVKISGMTTQSLEAGLQVLEAAATKALPPGSRFDYTGESRQLRQEGGKFVPAMGLALVVIFLALAAQFNSFRDPIVVLAGIRAAGDVRGDDLHLLEVRRPARPGLPVHRGVDHHAEHLFPGRPGDAGRPHRQERHPGGGVRQPPARERPVKGRRRAGRGRDRLRPILMTTIATVAGHFPLTLVSGPGAAARNSIGIVLVGGMAIGTIFTLFVVPSVYVLVAKDHRKERERKAQMAAAAVDGRPAPASPQITA